MTTYRELALMLAVGCVLILIGSYKFAVLLDWLDEWLRRPPK